MEEGHDVVRIVRRVRVADPDFYFDRAWFRVVNRNGSFGNTLPFRCFASAKRNGSSLGDWGFVMTFLVEIWGKGWR